MLEFIRSQENVIAARISGRITSEEIGRYIEHLEDALERHPETHIYAEVVDFSGLEMDDFGKHMRRGVAMLGELDRFGRIAVVADQTWIRWLARIESALLPKLSYKTFRSDERDVALAYVEGKTAAPRRVAMTVIETDRPTVWGFEIDGYLSADDIDAAVDHFAALLEQEQPLRMLARVRNLAGFAFGGIMDDDFFEMKLGMLRKIERYAVVGGPGWLSRWVTILDRMLPGIDIRHFAPEEEAAAWTWLEARPRHERPLPPDR